ncbi:MAG TPA: condensation domain-containing protein [Pyrinomonadaceae bacterium]
MVETAARIARLSPVKLELFARRLRETGGGATRAQAIRPRPSSDEAPPLSFAQQRLWLLVQFEPDNPFYNMPAAVRLTGRLDVDALGRALSEVARRHEVLRTTFALVEGRAVQVVNDAAPLPLPLTDLATLTFEERERESRRILNEEAARPFDLSSEPLLRARLVKLDAREYILVLVMHHIVSDGWSTTILVREASALYEAFAAGRPSPLAELPIQYADFAVWQRERLTGALLEAQLTYWKRQLSGAPPLSELPTDKPRPAMQSYRGASEIFTLDAELSEALKTLSRAENVTLFMTLLAGFKVLLSRSSGQTDLVVGTPIAGRDRSETEGLIGFFINSLALRTDLSGNPRFDEVLRRVEAACLGAYAHQEVPFEKVVEELRPERSLSHSPLFQIFFGLQNAPRIRNELEGLTFEPVGLERGTAQHDLVFNITDDGRTLKGIVDYNTDLYEAQTVKRLIQHYQTLLRGVTRSPRFDLREIGELLAEWDSQSWIAEGAEIERASLSKLKKIPRRRTGGPAAS